MVNLSSLNILSSLSWLFEARNNNSYRPILAMIINICMQHPRAEQNYFRYLYCYHRCTPHSSPRVWDIWYEIQFLISDTIRGSDIWSYICHTILFVYFIPIVSCSSYAIGREGSSRRSGYVTLLVVMLICHWVGFWG